MSPDLQFATKKIAKPRRIKITRREFAGADHGFTHAKPVEVDREAIQLIGEHLRRGYA